MNWVQLKILLEEARSPRLPISQAGHDIEVKLSSLLKAVLPGMEDPVLTMMLDDDTAELVRRTKWSSLVINPGSTSTKVSVYTGLKLVASDEVHIDPGQPDGAKARTAHICQWLERLGLDLQELTGIAARGGFVAPVPPGTYAVDEPMLEDLKNAPYNHASNLAAPIALQLAKDAGTDLIVTITDPVTCDEVDVVHRITGSQHIRTDGTASHYLNLNAVFTLIAKVLETDIEKLHLAACHMGGGMSAGRIEKGVIAQVVSAFGNLPSANRSGRLPLKEVLRLARDKQYSFDDMQKDVIASGGGLLALAGTNDFRALSELGEDSQPISADQRNKIDLILEFYAKSVAAGVMELAAVERPLDVIILTGGLAYQSQFCERITKKIGLPVPVVRIPGSVEGQALAAGLLRACAQPDSKNNYEQSRDALAKRRETEDTLLDTKIFDNTQLSVRGNGPTSLDDIIEMATPGDYLPVVAIAGADNEEALLAAKLANMADPHKLTRFVLIGSYARISELAWELDIPIDEENFFIVDTEDAVNRSIELLDAGLADFIMKGSVSTSELLKGYFISLKAKGLTGGNFKLGHLGFCEIPGRSKLVAVTDAAINPNPDLQTRIALLENALVALRKLGISKPKVAVISATEKASVKVVSSVEAEEIAERYKDRDDVIIEGPLPMDISLSAASAREKGYKGKIQGDADLLLVPTLDVGNAVYKAFTIAGGATVAGCVIGGPVPLVLTSRGDSARTKMASIALGLALTKEESQKLQEDGGDRK